MLPLFGTKISLRLCWRGWVVSEMGCPQLLLCVWPPLRAVLEVSVSRWSEAVAAADWAGLRTSRRSVNSTLGYRPCPGRLTPARTPAASPSRWLGGPTNNSVESGCENALFPPPPQGLLSSALYSHMPRFFPGPEENRHSPAQSISRRWVWWIKRSSDWVRELVHGEGAQDGHLARTAPPVCPPPPPAGQPSHGWPPQATFLG